MNAPAICTIVAKNYLAHARCLAESFLAQHPDGRVFVLLADRIDGYFDPSQEQFITIEACDLGIPEFEEMAFRYTVVEFNTAVKPFFMEYLFERYDLPNLCYFDPDIYFYQPLTRLHELLEEHSVVLTPHLLDVLDDDRMPDEPYILRAGVYNLGFIGLARGPELHKLLHWWQRKLVKDCVVDTARGLFVDQRWIDLVPGMFERVAILRDPGYNAAYWNLNHRHIRFEHSRWHVNEGLLTFYHFSGLPMHDVEAISKHQNRYSLADRPEMRPLFQHYRERLLANGYEQVRGWPYAYGWFDNRVAIPDEARRLWRNLGAGDRWLAPFSASAPKGFFNWLNQDVNNGAGRYPLVSNLAMELYRQRWDLQQAFPDVIETHREAYARWFVHSVEAQHQLDPAFVQPLRASLQRPPAHNGQAASAGQAAAPQSFPHDDQGGIYAMLREPVRRMGLKQPLKRVLPPQTIRYARVILSRAHWRQPLPEEPLASRPSAKRRLYYAVRNPLRRLGLHKPVKRLIGRRTMRAIRQGLIWDPNAPPLELTRSAAVPPPEAFFAMPAAPAGPGLNVVGYLSAETGVGEIPRLILRSLAAAGYPVAQIDLSNSDWARSTDRSVMHLPEGNPHVCTLLCVNADMLPQVVDQLGLEFFAGKYTIGFWHWETEHFPEQWHDRFTYLNEVWVDSDYVQKALAAVAPIPVVNVRLPIELPQPAALGRAELGLPEDRFLFLYSFDMRSFIERKNPHGLIEAYRRAFGTAGTETALVVKVTNLAAFPSEAAKLREALESVSGVLVDRYMDRPMLASLFAACDAYVSLHRSEGFGLTMAEAMALGKPVIATAYSGNMEFMNPSNSYLVGYRVVEIEQTFGPYQCGDLWADPDLDAAAERMRYVIANPEDAARRAARAAEDMRRFYGPDVGARRLTERLERIVRQH